MAYLIGGFVGGLIGIYILAAVWEWALYKRVMDDPLKGKMLSVLSAWITAGVIGGFGMANGGPYAWEAFLLYFLPALLVGFFAFRRGMQLREEQPPSAI